MSAVRGSEGSDPATALARNAARPRRRGWFRASLGASLTPLQALPLRSLSSWTASLRFTRRSACRANSPSIPDVTTERFKNG